MSSRVSTIAFRALVALPIILAILSGISLHAESFEGGDAHAVTTATLRPAPGQTSSETNDSYRPQPISKLWLASVAAVQTGVILDIKSSHKYRDYGDGIRWRRMEANPLYRSADGSFGVRGAAIRGGMVAGGLALEYLVLRRPDTPRWVVRTLSIVNFCAAGISAGAAHRNWTMDGRPPEARR